MRNPEFPAYGHAIIGRQSCNLFTQLRGFGLAEHSPLPDLILHDFLIQLERLHP
jgi:hypothetical protein